MHLLIVVVKITYNKMASIFVYGNVIKVTVIHYSFLEGNLNHLRGYTVSSPIKSIKQQGVKQRQGTF